MQEFTNDENIILENILCEDAKDFIDAISYGHKYYNIFYRKNEDIKDSKGVYNDEVEFAFRGQESDSYVLKPNALRDNNIKETKVQQVIFEFLILKNFYLLCDKHGLYIPENDNFRKGIFTIEDYKEYILRNIDDWLPTDLYDITALAQHYGLPTRLLDWTYNINTAIYFAVNRLYNEQIKDEYPSKVENQNESTKEDDNVRTSKIEYGDCQTENSDIAKKFVKDNEGSFLTIWAMNISYDVTKKLYEDPNIDFPLKLLRPIYKYNPNLQAQQGLFTLWKNKKTDEFEKEPLDKLLSDYVKDNGLQDKIHETLMYCFYIPKTKENISRLYHYILRNFTDTSSLFPGYQGVANLLKEEFIYKLSDGINDDKVVKECKDAIDEYECASDEYKCTSDEYKCATKKYKDKIKEIMQKYLQRLL